QPGLCRPCDHVPRVRRALRGRRVVKPETAEALRNRLAADPDADTSSLRCETDKTLAIGQDTWRLRWRCRCTTVVAEDADLHSTCGAMFDAVAVLEATTEDPGDDLDRAGVN